MDATSTVNRVHAQFMFLAPDYATPHGVSPVPTYPPLTYQGGDAYD